MGAADPFSLEGKRILGTVASAGIGRQGASACAQMGAQLVVSGRNGERLSATRAEVEGEGHAASQGAQHQQRHDLQLRAQHQGRDGGGEGERGAGGQPLGQALGDGDGLQRRGA